MTKLFLTLTAIAALTACKKGADAPAKKSELVTKLEALADRGCACKDAACADATSAAVQELASGTSAAAIPEGDLPALQAAQARLDECLGKLDARVVAYVALVDEVCACKDAGCAEKVSAKFDAWSADVRTAKKPIPGGLKAIAADGARAMTCFKKLGVTPPK